MNRGRDSTLSRAAALSVGCLVLAGCGQLAVQQDWNRAATFPPLQPVYRQVAATELPSICGAHPGMYLHGCAVRDYAARVCVIYTRPQPAQWLLDHERKHCAGWDHDAPRTFNG